MQVVEPIRDKKKLDDMKVYLKGKNLRDYCMFVVGINSGLRISDLLNLKIMDVADKTRSGYVVADRIEIREQKTNKIKDFPINRSAKTAIKEYLDAERMESEPDAPLFRSQKGGAITAVNAWMRLNDAAKAIGIKERIGTHTLRKTFGYFSYKSGVDITVIQQLLNHASPHTTLRYIGITKDDLDSVYNKLNL